MKVMRLQQSGQSPPTALTGASQARHEGGNTWSMATVAAVRAERHQWPHVPTTLHRLRHLPVLPASRPSCHNRRHDPARVSTSTAPRSSTVPPCAPTATAPPLASRGGADFLVREVGERLVGRLDDVKRRFARVLDLGCHGGQLGPMLRRQAAPDLLVEADLSPAMVAYAAGPARLVADEEWLPIRADSLDLVVSALSLHWVNDLPGALVQIRRALKPDGLLLAAMLGRRDSVRAARGVPAGGGGPGRRRSSSCLTVPRCADPGRPAAAHRFRAAGGRQRPNHGHLRERRGADARSAGHGREPTPPPGGHGTSPSAARFAHAASACYREMFGGTDGRIPATFQVLYLTGWRPARIPAAARAPGQRHRRSGGGA